MRFWNQYPFFRLIIPFAAGIILAINLPKPSFVQSWHLITICIVLFSMALLTSIFVAYTRRWMAGIFIYLFTFSAGYSITVVQTEIHSERHFSNFLDGEQVLVIKINEPPVERAKSVRVFGKVRYVIDSVVSKRTIGKALFYLEKDSAALGLRYGDLLIVQAGMIETQPPGNPHQFDYKKYLANSGIHHQAYLRSGKWYRIDSGMVNPVFEFSYGARDRMLHLLEKQGLAGDEYAVVSAILLGYDDRLEPELRDLYAGAGALHVLCVSGLHVGIVFIIVGFLFRRFHKTKPERVIKFVVLLLSIWAYAFITGLAPSVMRAALMFSLFSWRELAKEKSNSYNVVAASAFILLAIDPYLITKIGFQLSYSAVLGIIALNTPLYRLLAFKNPVADYVWQLSVVSVAAQIGTFPLSIYYFNQFPLYFLFSNIIVIPLVWLIVYTGVATLFVAVFWNFLSTILAKLLFYQVYLLNYFVELINRLPAAKIDGLMLNFPQVIAVYLLAILITRFLIKKQANYAVAALSLGLLLTVSFVFQKFQTLNQQKLVIYSVNGHSAIDFFIGNQLIGIADTALFKDTRTIDFNLEANRIFSGAQFKEQLAFNTLTLESMNLSNLTVKYFYPNLFLAGDTRIAVVDNGLPDFMPETPLRTDIVVLRENTDKKIPQILKMFDFDQLVFDSSNSPWKVREWRSYCDEHQIDYYDVREKGALVRAL
ncbi:MAG: ComEC family competence protein [Bacteroidales bacterium]|nr:ComEC family competence protein [Bacteroidales bacterium]